MMEARVPAPSTGVHPGPGESGNGSSPAAHPDGSLRVRAAFAAL